MLPAAALAHPPANHLAQFYADDRELVDAVARHVLNGQDAGALVVATEAHRQAIDARLAELRRAGMHPSAAVVMLDADATLRRFYDGDRLDPVRFAAVIGAAIRDCAHGDSPVRVYGEMVALLWDAGQVNVAVELEQLWNDLSAQVSFSLLCGYPTHSTLAGREAIRRVCAEHSEVIGLLDAASPAEAQQSFVGAPGTPALVRRFVTTTLTAWDATAQLDDVVLVADELVTNAIVHARSDVSITLSGGGDSIRIAVTDTSPTAPRPAERGAAATSGRGLQIVDILSSAWGYRRSGSGKTVWARFDA